MNREPLVTGEHYHIYNRGVDKRQLFSDLHDVDRFFLGMTVFNSVKPIFSIRDFLDIKDNANTIPDKKLVEFVAYCFNPNHYHFILKQLVDGGIAEFMKRLNGGYTWYFNKRNDRNGALLQGTYKSKHVSDNDKFLELSVYVNMNNKVHKISGENAKLVRSSWAEYTNGVVGLCEKKSVLEQFNDISEYKKFAFDTLPLLHKRKEEEKELKVLMLEQ